jgi:heme/copper-type cytochrome/quinol oxidase subunit 2
MLGWWLPENASTYGGSVFHLIYWTSGIGLLIAQAVLSRRRDVPPPSHPTLELVWAIVPALMLVWLGLLSHRSWSAVADGRPQIALEQVRPDTPHTRADIGDAWRGRP